MKLLQKVHREIVRRNYSYHTEKSYVYWIKKYVNFHNLKHPQQLDQSEIVDFLNHLSVNEHVAASTQNQALSALVFLYKHILKQDIGELKNLKRAKKPKHLPTVLSKNEADRILEKLEGVEYIVCCLMYGSGLRISEALRLRVQDIDFDYNQILIRRGKGNRDRVTVLPQLIKPLLSDQIKKVKNLHEQDLAKGFGQTILPSALAKKYPREAGSLKWQYIFPSKKRRKDPQSGIWYRYHIHPKKIRRSVKMAAKETEISKNVSPHTFRHSFATLLLQNGYDIRTVQDLLGHRSLKTTSVYLHVLNRGGKGVKSPLDT